MNYEHKHNNEYEHKHAREHEHERKHKHKHKLGHKHDSTSMNMNTNMDGKQQRSTRWKILHREGTVKDTIVRIKRVKSEEWCGRLGFQGKHRESGV